MGYASRLVLGACTQGVPEVGACRRTSVGLRCIGLLPVWLLRTALPVSGGDLTLTERSVQ